MGLCLKTEGEQVTKMSESVKGYRCVLVGVLFDENYAYEETVLLGVSEKPETTFSIQMEEIMRLYEDYGEDDKKPIEYSETESEYGEIVCVIKYPKGYEHIYSFFDNNQC